MYLRGLEICKGLVQLVFRFGLPSCQLILIALMVLLNGFSNLALGLGEACLSCVVEGGTEQGRWGLCLDLVVIRNILGRRIDAISGLVVILENLQQLLALHNITINYFDRGILVQICKVAGSQSTLLSLLYFRASSFILSHVRNMPNRRLRLLLLPNYSTRSPSPLKSICFSSIFHFECLLQLEVWVHRVEGLLGEVGQVARVVLQVDAQGLHEALHHWCVVNSILLLVLCLHLLLNPILKQELAFNETANHLLLRLHLSILPVLLLSWHVHLQNLVEWLPFVIFYIISSSNPLALLFT